MVWDFNPHNDSFCNYFCYHAALSRTYLTLTLIQVVEQFESILPGVPEPQARQTVLVCCVYELSEFKVLIVSEDAGGNGTEIQQAGRAVCRELCEQHFLFFWKHNVLQFMQGYRAQHICTTTYIQ